MLSWSSLLFFTIYWSTFPEFRGSSPITGGRDGFRWPSCFNVAMHYFKLVLIELKVLPSISRPSKGFRTISLPHLLGYCEYELHTSNRRPENENFSGIKSGLLGTNAIRSTLGDQITTIVGLRC